MPGINSHTPQAYSGGSWKNWEAVSGNIDGTWRTASDVYVKHNDTWKQVWVRLTAPTGGSRSINHVTVTISWTAGVGQEGFKLYRNGVFVKNVAANATSTTDVVPEMYVDYTYTVSAYAGDTETEQISCGAAVQATVGSTTSSASVTTWEYTNDSWNNNNLTAVFSCTSVSNATGYEYIAGGSWTNESSRSIGISLYPNSSVTVYWRAYVTHNNVTYYGPTSNAKTVSSGRPRVRTARTDDYVCSAWDSAEEYTAPSARGGGTSSVINANYNAEGTIVDSYRFVNLSTSPWASQITSSTRSVVLRKMGTNVTLSGTPYINNGYDSPIYTDYADSTISFRIDPTGTGWFTKSNSNRLTGVVRFNVRYVSQTEIAPSVS